MTDIATRPDPSEASMGRAKVAWLEAVDRVQAAGEFAVDAVLLVGQDAALEIVIAVGGGERHFRFGSTGAKEAGKRAADFVTGLVHELVQVVGTSCGSDVVE